MRFYHLQVFQVACAYIDVMYKYYCMDICEAWSRIEAGLHRSLASYVIMRYGRTEGTRRELHSLARVMHACDLPFDAYGSSHMLHAASSSDRVCVQAARDSRRRQIRKLG